MISHPSSKSFLNCSAFLLSYTNPGSLKWSQGIKVEPFSQKNVVHESRNASPHKLLALPQQTGPSRCIIIGYLSHAQLSRKVYISKGDLAILQNIVATKHTLSYYFFIICLHFNGFPLPSSPTAFRRANTLPWLKKNPHTPKYRDQTHLYDNSQWKI